jgi:hypothetical protein
VKNQDQLMGIVLIIFALLGLKFSLEIPDTGIATVSVAFYPKVLFICLGLCGIGIWLQGFRNPQGGFPKLYLKKTLPMIVLLLLYAFSLDWVGYIPSTLLFTFIALWSLRVRKLWELIGIPIVSTFAVYYLFVYAFRIILP